MDRRVTPPKRVTSPTCGTPPPCNQALRLKKNLDNRCLMFMSSRKREITMQAVSGRGRATTAKKKKRETRAKVLFAYLDDVVAVAT